MSLHALGLVPAGAVPYGGASALRAVDSCAKYGAVKFLHQVFSVDRSRPHPLALARSATPAIDPRVAFLKAAARGFRNELVVRETRQIAKAAPAQTTASSKATADAPSEIRPVLVAPMTPASPSSTAPIARSDSAKTARLPRVP